MRGELLGRVDPPPRADGVEGADGGRRGGGHDAASALIVSIALLNPPLVRDEPATRETEISSMLLPTTSPLMPPMNWLWYCSDSRFCGLPVTSTAVMTSS